MIPHPSIWWESEAPRKQDSMWKKFLVWLVKLMPGVLQTIMVEKAKEDAARAGAGKPPTAPGI